MAKTDYYSIIQNHLTQFRQGLFTALPARVVEFFPERMAVDVEVIVPSIFNGKVEPPTPLADVPVIFPSAGGGMISFPVQEGDTVLLMFCMRDISAWKEGDGERAQPTSTRTQDKNDAVAIVGLFAQEQAKPDVPTDAVQIQYGGSTVKLEDSKIVIDGGSIEIGAGSTEKVVLGDTFQTYFDGHTHNAGTLAAPNGAVTGVTGSPTAGMPDDTLSDTVTVE